MRAIRWLLITSLCLPVRAAFAQRQDSVSQIGAVLARLHAGSMIRVHNSSQGWVQGLVDSTGHSFLFLSRDDEQRQLPFAGTDSVFVGHARTGHGFLIGAAIVGVAGALVGAQIESMCASGTVCGPQHGLIPIGFAVGGLVGGLVGAAFGSSSTRWSLEAP